MWPALGGERLEVFVGLITVVVVDKIEIYAHIP